MGSLRVTVCTGVLVSVALTPAAYAADAGGVSVIPAVPAPGGDVTLRVTGCAQRTAVAVSAAFVADARLTVTDGGLAGESRVRSTLEPGTYTVKVTCGDAERTSRFTVREGEGQRPAPGSGSGSGSGSVSAPGTVGQPLAPGAARHSPAPGTAGQPPLPEGGGQPPEPEEDGQPPEPEEGGQSPEPGDDGQAPAVRRPGAHASPVAPVAAGGGGAADHVAAADRGAAPGPVQGVAGLALAGVAAVAVALRGVRRSRGTD
ncbi:hypothetical protein KEF29_27375 [Streptomyces tuirus]|uniref:Uncharacterized protein n=1 Tax=Streptomyces tuirus TaxID=68278 RepID=A0A941FDG1_9ACTN|nr:hypothetical protein [Streptomyces tuirus]